MGVAWSWMGHALRRGSWWTLGAETMAVVGLAYFFVGGRVLRRVSAAQRWRLSTDTRGTVLHPNRLRVAVFLSSVMSLLLGLFLMGLLQVLGRLEIPFHEPLLLRERLLQGWFVAAGAVCGLAVLAICGAFMWARGDAGSLIVDARGVAVSVGRKSAVTWDAVRGIPMVGPAKSDYGVYDPPDLIVEASPAPLKLSMTNFPADAEPAARIIRFYWQQPALRDELCDGLAVRRWAAGEFGPVS